MENEIKETINILYEFATNINSDYIYDAQGFDYPLISDCIEELLDYITNLQEEKDYYFKKNNELSTLNTSLRNDRDILKTRNEKAIEYITSNLIQNDITTQDYINRLNELLEILQGKSDE